MFCLPLLQTAIQKCCPFSMAEVVECEVSACCGEPRVVTVEHNARIVADAQTLEKFLKVSHWCELVRHAVARRGNLAPADETRSGNVALIKVSPLACHMQNDDLRIVQMSSK